MPWSKNDYPASLKNLTEEVRGKAVDIGNALLDEGYEEQRAVAIATAQAEKWALHRDKPIRKPDTKGDTGHAVAKESSQFSHCVHLVPDPQRQGWIVRQEKQQLAQGRDRNDVLNKARKAAKSDGVSLCIHDQQGHLEAEEDYS